jgi:hypothetical protein
MHQERRVCMREMEEEIFVKTNNLWTYRTY